MQSPSGGDTAPDLDPEKEAEPDLEPEKEVEGEEDGNDAPAEFTEETQLTHDPGDSGEDEEKSEGEEEEERNSRDDDEEEEVEKVEEQQEEEVEDRSEYVIEAENILPEEEEEKEEEEEVEEYEYTKEEVNYIKTAFVAYQIEKEQKKKGFTPRKKEGKEKKVTEIPVSTLGSVLRSLGLNPTQAALQRHADWLDADPVHGVVKFEELLIIVGREKKVVIDESHVLEAFRSIDVKNEKSISIGTLHELLVLTGEKFGPEEWIIFVHLADPKNSGFVDYENFVARMGPNPPSPEKKKKGKKGKNKKKGKSK